MALKNNYNLVVSYTLSRFGSKENYINLLTEEQIKDLESSLEKSFLIENAYYKIDSVKGNKNNIDIQVGVYKDETKQRLISVNNYSLIPDMNSTDNFIKQGYEYLKTLDEYKNSVDLLDEEQTVSAT